MLPCSACLPYLLRLSWLAIPLSLSHSHTHTHTHTHTLSLSLSLAPDYQTAVQNALAATQDILGDLGLDIPQSVPDTTRQSGVQEVEIKMYDSDSLPSPPPSSESDTEQDPLLDFTRNDDLTYNTGQKPSQTLAESVREATKALEVYTVYSARPLISMPVCVCVCVCRVFRN